MAFNMSGNESKFWYMIEMLVRCSTGNRIHKYTGGYHLFNRMESTREAVSNRIYSRVANFSFDEINNYGTAEQVFTDETSRQ